MPDKRKDDRMSDNNKEFIALFSQCQRELYVYIMALYPDATEAQDILQETSLILWEKFSDFDRERSFSAWARGFAHNKVLQHRKRNYTQASFMRKATLEIVAKQMQQERELGDEPIQEALAACLSHLSRADRDLIKQRYAPDACVQSLAKKLGRTPNAISQALRRIRRALHECITRRMAAESGGI